jgi:hypothetical protein
MKYLGVLRGNGVLLAGDETMGPVAYEIEGYTLRPGEITGSGDLRMEPDDLARAFGQRGLRLRTDDGRELSVRFTARKLASQSSTAHADVTGDLPAAAAWSR